ncbi:MAG: hypothetical protein DRR08_27135 [Candidatus Parabeggiatoa sp. nov. 2]|nr:MAG: hypothetical protein B6247_26525 [Beggiatoa sp. 4572_84]RKZ53711.1 MAG: hypothetical protein DRR08_27135 [Gammaproteobacteria bacterium]
MKRTVLAIPDSGPLISLGVADRLELLLKLDMPIYIVDQVLYECTSDLTKLGARAIVDLVENHPDVVHVDETFVGKAAKIERESGVNKRHRGLGEAAIAEFFANIDDKIDPSEPVLILFEDSDIRRINAFIQGNAHLLSTKALLVGMEECSLIESAEVIWQSIINAGRKPSEKIIDQSSPYSAESSSWKPPQVT